MENQNTKNISSDIFSSFWAGLENKQQKHSQKVEALKTAFLQGDLKTQIAAAGNPALPSGLLLQGASSENSRIREAVASNPAAPVAALLTLSEDHEIFVKKAVARNPHTPPTILFTLADSENWRVREAVASHPGAGVEGLFEKLAADSQPEVVRALFENDFAMGHGMKYAMEDSPEIFGVNPFLGEETPF